MKRILQITLIALALLTVFFLWLFLRNANLSEVWALLKKTNVGWVMVGFVVNFGALLFRTIRWRTILDPENPPPFYATFFANTVGYMLSTILPIRAADSRGLRFSPAAPPTVSPAPSARCSPSAVSI